MNEEQRSRTRAAARDARTTLALLAGAALATTVTTLPVHGEVAVWQSIPGAVWASDITPDGRVVVGSTGGGGYYWTCEDGFVDIGGRSAVAVSDDGSKILGDIIDPGGSGFDAAAIWTEADGWQSIDDLGGIPLCGGSTAFDLSGDGTVATGLRWDSCTARGFQWTEAGGMTLLDLLNGQERAPTSTRAATSASPT